jgi:hypothetical protein
MNLPSLTVTKLDRRFELLVGMDVEIEVDGTEPQAQVKIMTIIPRIRKDFLFISEILLFYKISIANVSRMIVEC